MSRRYHRYVGGKTAPFSRVATEAPILCGVTGPTHVKAHCCPDVMPWDLCQHQKACGVPRETGRSA